MTMPRNGHFDIITGPNRVRINSDFVAKATTLHDLWLDFDHPVRLKRIQWSEDLDDAGREKVEQLLRATQEQFRKGNKHRGWTQNGIRKWLQVAEEYRAAREAKPE